MQFFDKMVEDKTSSFNHLSYVCGKFLTTQEEKKIHQKVDEV